MKILNLTQHPATAEQIAAGVVDLPTAAQAELRGLLTFDSLPEPEDVADRAEAIAALGERFVADEDTAAMIGGAPFLMPALERAIDWGAVMYAFSRRESVEEMLPDGSVQKRAVFRHAGFVVADHHI